jgi:hypothetical protein
VDKEAPCQKQRQREASAYQSVLMNLEKCRDTPSAALEEYVKKTQATFSIAFSQVGEQAFVCTLTYARELLSAEFQRAAASEKTAKANATTNMINRFRTETAE